MAAPQPLKEARLALEYSEGGTKLVVRDSGGPEAGVCGIRNRGGEALARLLQEDRKISMLDLCEAKMTDNDVGNLCLALRQTDQLTELSLGCLGHVGLEFLLGVVRRCSQLRSVRFEVHDIHTLHQGSKILSSVDYNTSAYVVVKGDNPGDDDEEGEEEEQPPAGDEEDEESAEEKQQKKIAALKAMFKENDYDSGDEGPAAAVATAAAKTGCSPVLSQLLGELASTVRKMTNLTAVECVGGAVPQDVLVDLERTIEDNRRLAERRAQIKEERGSRTAQAALRDQLDELRSGLEEAEICPEGGTRIPIREYIGHRLFAALGEALFECQRFKSKDNEAVSTAEGEMAFIAMYLRKHAKLHAEAAKRRR